MCTLNNEPAGSAPRGMDDKRNSWDMVAPKEAASFGLRKKLQEIQRVRDDAADAALTTNVEVAELASEGVKAKRRNATLSEQNTKIEAILVEACVVKNAMCEQFVAAQSWITTLKTQLLDAQLALRKQTGKYFKTEADL